MSDNQPPQYGAYPQLPEHNSGTSVTNPTSEPPIFPTRAATQPPKKKRTGLLVGLAILVVALLAGGFLAFRNLSVNGPAAAAPATATTKAPTPLEAVVDKCYVHADPEDLGRTLTLSNVGAKKNAGDDDMSTAQCVFTALKVPSSVLDHIGQTRALDGMQNDSWEGFNARWTYHPDSGMNITITEAK